MTFLTTAQRCPSSSSVSPDFIHELLEGHAGPPGADALAEFCKFARPFIHVGLGPGWLRTRLQFAHAPVHGLKFHRTQPWQFFDDLCGTHSTDIPHFPPTFT